MPHSPFKRLDDWLERRRTLVLAILLALSVAPRFIMFVELNGGPALWLHRWESTDMHFFDLWARGISEGDLLTDRSLHPYSPWHERLAEEFIRRYPEETRAALGRPVLNPEDRGASRALWQHWYGGKRLHQGPLYPYLVALTYRLLEPDPRWVFGWQMVLGVLSTALLYLIARRHFGDLIATVTGLLAALCGPLLFYETVLLRSALITFLGLLLVYLADSALARKASHATGWWLMTGVVLGLSILLKMTFAIFGLGLVAVLALRLRQEPKKLILPVLALALGTLLALSPLVVRNALVGAPLTSSSSVGPVTYASANNADYRPGSGFGMSARLVPEIFAKSDGRFLPTVVETLKTHPDVSSWMKQQWGKFTSVWHWYETPNNLSFYYARLHSAVLRYLPITFWLLAPMGLLGLVLGLRRAPSLATLYLLLVTHLIPLVLFYLLSRFRVPLATALMPFAALALVSMAGWVASRDWKRLAFASAGVVLVMLSTAKPIDHPEIKAAYYQVPFMIFYTPGTNFLFQQASASDSIEDWQYVARFIEDSLRTEPDLVKHLGPEYPAQNQDEAVLAAVYSNARRRLAQALTEAGDPEAARQVAQRAEELRAAATSTLLEGSK